MANEFHCSKCGYTEGSHDVFAELQQRASDTSMVGVIESALKLKEEFKGICDGYKKTEEEILFDKNNPCYIK